MAETVNVTTLIDRRKVGGFQYLVAALCAITVFLDGYDTQSIAFVAPSIAQELHLTRPELGPLFVASLVGLLIGALSFGIVADKLGRRTVIIVCTAVFGILTLVATTSTSFQELLVWRFLAGLGLGGAMPNGIALTAEYCPTRRRATIVMIMFTGFSLGAAFGGAVAASLIPIYGWRSVWYVGGILPLLLVPVQFDLAAGIDSFPGRHRCRGLAHRQAGAAHRSRFPPVIRNALRRRRGPCPWRAGGASLPPGPRHRHLPVVDHVLHQPAVDILPAELDTDHGARRRHRRSHRRHHRHPVPGRRRGRLFLDRLADRPISAYPVISVLFFCGVLFVALIGVSAGSVAALLALTFGAGFCIVGGQNSANALAAIFYPTSMRSTGVGWALGIGRFGAILGPLIAGVLLGAHMSYGMLFLLGALAPVCSTLAILGMGRVYGK